MDKLARDATNAIRKGMSYGQYMAQKKPEIIIPTPPKDVEMRECLRCGKLFPLNKQGSGKKKYCSDECREKFYAERDSKTETGPKNRTRTKTKVKQKCVQRATTYVADFVYEQDGKTIVEDTKGFRTKEYELKKKMMRAFLGIEIKEI